MNRVDLIWDKSRDVPTLLEVDGQKVDLSSARRVVVAVDENMADPIVDVSLGTPLPMSLSDDARSPGEMTPLQFIENINVDQLKREVLSGIGGWGADDPITRTLKILRRMAGGD